MNERSLSQMKCRVIAGAANNQLDQDYTAKLVQEAGILYAPDYVINAGGIINIACEHTQKYDAELATQMVDKIQDRIREIFVRAKVTGETTLAVAAEMAKERFEERHSSTFRVENLSQPAGKIG